MDLSHRRSDRADKTDVAAQHADVAGRMKADVLNWITQENALKVSIGPGGSTPLDRNTLERLRSLGYLGGSNKGQ